MANNYRQFSEQIADLSDEACAWLEHVLTLDIEDDHDELYKELGLMVDSAIDVECWPDFEWRIEEHSFWLYANEGGDTDHIALIVQALIKKYMPSYIFTLTTAEYCSKPRIGEFGGGWMVVTKDEVAGGSVWDDVDDWIKRHHPAHVRTCSHDPREMAGKPIGMYHCPECGEMVLAGVPHPDYSVLTDPAHQKEAVSEKADG